MNFFSRKHALSGFSLLEAIAVMGGLSLIGLGVSYVVTQQKRAQGTLETKTELVGLMQLTLTELNQKKAKALPAVQNCLVRSYGPTRLFESETLYPISNAECAQAVPTLAGFRITMRFLPAADIDVTYSPSSFLKLPQYLPSVKMVQVFGGYREGAKNQLTGQLAATIYRRDF